MSMSSHFAALAPRRVPQQQRGRRRVTRLLRAAEQEIAESGYQATTMCAIARRARSSVGSLYQIFPGTEAVAEALRASYVAASRDRWRELTAEAAGLDAGELAGRIIEIPLTIAGQHPAFLSLLDLPATVHSLRRREIIRARIAETLRAGRPGAARASALRDAAVVHQLVRGCLVLYSRAGENRRAAIAREFQELLAHYLRAKWRRS